MPPIRNGVYYPDFQADDRPVPWVQFDDKGQQTGQDVGQIGTAFKQRLLSGSKGAAPIGGTEGKTMPSAGAAASGGFKSL